MSDEEKKENPLDGIKQEMFRLLNQQWAKRLGEWRAQAQPFSAQVETEATRILSDSDIDREAAKLLLDHHQTELTDALDRKDPEAFRRASEEVSSHKEAEGLLSKPKGHFTRQEFERKQAAAVSPKGAFER